MAKVSEFLGRLQSCRKAGDGKWIACCPAHPDKSPSLGVKVVGDKVLVHCFAGCEVADIVAAVGMELSDLMPDRLEGFVSRAGHVPKFSAYDLFPAMAEKALFIEFAMGQMLGQLDAGGIAVSGEWRGRIEAARDGIRAMVSEAGMAKAWRPKK
jgi:hypothetical protein